MKFLVTRVFDDTEDIIGLYDSLDTSMRVVKDQCLSPYYGDKFRIYNVSSPLTVRFLDDKIFID